MHGTVRRPPEPRPISVASHAPIRPAGRALPPRVPPAQGRERPSTASASALGRPAERPHSRQSALSSQPSLGRPSRPASALAALPPRSLTIRHASRQSHPVEWRQLAARHHSRVYLEQAPPPPPPPNVERAESFKPMPTAEFIAMLDARWAAPSDFGHTAQLKGALAQLHGRQELRAAEGRPGAEGGAAGGEEGSASSSAHSDADSRSDASSDDSHGPPDPWDELLPGVDEAMMAAVRPSDARGLLSAGQYELAAAAYLRGMTEQPQLYDTHSAGFRFALRQLRWRDPRYAGRFDTRVVRRVVRTQHARVKRYELEEDARTGQLVRPMVDRPTGIAGLHGWATGNEGASDDPLASLARTKPTYNDGSDARQFDRHMDRMLEEIVDLLPAEQAEVDEWDIAQLRAFLASRHVGVFAMFRRYAALDRTSEAQMRIHTIEKAATVSKNDFTTFCRDARLLPPSQHGVQGGDSEGAEDGGVFYLQQEEEEGRAEAGAPPGRGGARGGGKGAKKGAAAKKKRASIASAGAEAGGAPAAEPAAGADEGAGCSDGEEGGSPRKRPSSAAGRAVMSAEQVNQVFIASVQMADAVGTQAKEAASAQQPRGADGSASARAKQLPRGRTPRPMITPMAVVSSDAALLLPSFLSSMVRLAHARYGGSGATLATSLERCWNNHFRLASERADDRLRQMLDAKPMAELYYEYEDSLKAIFDYHARLLAKLGGKWKTAAASRGGSDAAAAAAARNAASRLAIRKWIANRGPTLGFGEWGLFWQACWAALEEDEAEMAEERAQERLGAAETLGPPPGAAQHPSPIFGVGPAGALEALLGGEGAPGALNASGGPAASPTARRELRAAAEPMPPPLNAAQLQKVFLAAQSEEMGDLLSATQGADAAVDVQMTWKEFWEGLVRTALELELPQLQRLHEANVRAHTHSKLASGFAGARQKGGLSWEALARRAGASGADASPTVENCVVRTDILLQSCLRAFARMWGAERKPKPLPAPGGGRLAGGGADAGGGRLGGRLGAAAAAGGAAGPPRGLGGGLGAVVAKATNKRLSASGGGLASVLHSLAKDRASVSPSHRRSSPGAREIRQAVSKMQATLTHRAVALALGRHVDEAGAEGGGGAEGEARRGRRPSAAARAHSHGVKAHGLPPDAADPTERRGARSALDRGATHGAHLGRALSAQPGASAALDAELGEAFEPSDAEPLSAHADAAAAAKEERRARRRARKRAEAEAAAGAQLGGAPTDADAIARALHVVATRPGTAGAGADAPSLMAMARAAGAATRPATVDDTSALLAVDAATGAHSEALRRARAEAEARQREEAEAQKRRTRLSRTPSLGGSSTGASFRAAASIGGSAHKFERTASQYSFGGGARTASTPPTVGGAGRRPAGATPAPGGAGRPPRHASPPQPQPPQPPPAVPKLGSRRASRDRATVARRGSRPDAPAGGAEGSSALETALHAGPMVPADLGEAGVGSTSAPYVPAAERRMSARRRSSSRGGSPPAALMDAEGPAKQPHEASAGSMDDIAERLRRVG